jgi:hypothetical protein
MSDDTENTGNTTTTIREMGETGQEDEHPVAFKAPEQLSLNIGGRKPDTSWVSMKSIAREVEGQYKQDGEVIAFLVYARVDETKHTDQHDADGRIIARKRTAVLTPQSIKPIPGELVERMGL